MITPWRPQIICNIQFGLYLLLLQEKGVPHQGHVLYEFTNTNKGKGKKVGV